MVTRSTQRNRADKHHMYMYNSETYRSPSRHSLLLPRLNVHHQPILRVDGGAYTDREKFII